MGPIQTRIIEKLKNGIQTVFLDAVNESDMHNVPEGSESHFKITIVSPEFEGKNRRPCGPATSPSQVAAGSG